MFGKKPLFTATMENDGGMEVRIDHTQIERPEYAGLMLADFAGHFANAMHQSGKADSAEAAMATMLEWFLKELQNPTDTPEGEIQ